MRLGGTWFVKRLGIWPIICAQLPLFVPKLCQALQKLKALTGTPKAAFVEVAIQISYAVELTQRNLCANIVICWEGIQIGIVVLCPIQLVVIPFVHANTHARTHARAHAHTHTHTHTHMEREREREREREMVGVYGEARYLSNVIVSSRKRDI